MIASSELILNPDGSIYHLNLLPSDIANTIITVGDPSRVDEITKHFDSIEIKKQKREFCTHTGFIGKKRISVLSTGIGTDNIDIVLNELDSLVNIDFNSRTAKENHTSLTIIRLGTSGALRPEIPLGALLASQFSIGMDGLMHFYERNSLSEVEMELENSFLVYLLDKNANILAPYAAAGHKELLHFFKTDFSGITITNTGFYGPQGRKLRLVPKVDSILDLYAGFESPIGQITNLEMETAGIYGLCGLLGHKAISLNTIIANRPKGKFHPKPQQAVDEAIQWLLEKIEQL